MFFGLRGNGDITVTANRNPAIEILFLKTPIGATFVVKRV
jgi:hypothetical protein